MAHELSTVSTGSGAAIVCIGDAWHGLQNPFTGNVDKDLAQAGLNFDVVKLRLFAEKPGTDTIDGMMYVPGRWSNARSDTFASLGISADGYKVHQPSDLHKMVTGYFADQDGWQLSSMGSLKGGREIWFAARYKDHIVGGMNHHRYALLSTSFDTTQASRLQPTDVNVVCNNTLRAAWSGADCVVKWNHSKTWDAKAVAGELSRVLAGSERYKVIGDALATVAVTDEFNKTFFKTLVGIDPKETDKDKIATRTMNNYAALWAAYKTSMVERNGDQSAFTALNAVTRYVDHTKTVQGGDRMSSATFGAGDRFKGQALSLLMPLIQDKVAA
jgi:phage/plasmid-like protein (TIGR03299 family)